MTTLTMTTNFKTSTSPIITNLFTNADLFLMVENTRNIYSLKSNGKLSTDMLSNDDLKQELFMYMHNLNNGKHNINTYIETMERQIDKLTLQLDDILKLGNKMDIDTYINITNKLDKKVKKYQFLSKYKSTELETSLAYGIIKCCLFNVLCYMSESHKKELGITTDFTNIINANLKYKSSNGIDGTRESNNNNLIIAENKRFYTRVCKDLNLKDYKKDLLLYTKINTYKPTTEEIKKGIKDFYKLSIEQLCEYKGYSIGTVKKGSAKFSKELETYLKDCFNNNKN